jgi:hypothetical protein
MQPKDKWKDVGIFLIVLCSFLLSATSIVPLVLCDEDTSVNVKFEVLTGSGTQDYFTGDRFWYNITLTDSGTTDINATFTVTVRNTTGEYSDRLRLTKNTLNLMTRQRFTLTILDLGKKRFTYTSWIRSEHML